MAKVSICIPSYNNVKAVERLMKSIAEQDYKDYEIIITDDSIDDQVYELVKDKPEVQYYKNEKRLGSTANWNESMRKSSGEYVKIMHHDDWFTDKGSLGKFVRLLAEHPEADLAFCGTRQVAVDQSYDRHISSAEAALIKEDYRNLYLGNTIGAPSATIYKKSVADYDENLVWLVDMEFYMHILKNNPQFVYTKKPLLSIGISSTQLTEECIGDEEINVREYGYIYKKYCLHEVKEYSDKLFQVFMDNNASYENAKDFAISRLTYTRGRLAKWMGKVKWKLGIRK